ARPRPGPCLGGVAGLQFRYWVEVSTDGDDRRRACELPLARTHALTAGTHVSPYLGACMNSRERVWAALEGREVGRPPVSFWGHRYDRESTATDLVQATVEFQREYGWDYVKLNPRKSYFVEDWGVRYAYSGRRAEKPRLVEWPIHTVADWHGIRPLAPD